MAVTKCVTPAAKAAATAVFAAAAVLGSEVASRGISTPLFSVTVGTVGVAAAAAVHSASIIISANPIVVVFVFTVCPECPSPRPHATTSTIKGKGRLVQPKL